MAARAGLAVLVAGCSADVAMFRADWNWWSNSQAPLYASTAPPEGLLGSDGQCLSEGSPARGIALGMTECDLVRIAGLTEQISIATNERGERVVVLTYPQGERAGIYRFASGLLVTIEQVPQPVKPQRPQRRQQQRS